GCTEAITLTAQGLPPGVTCPAQVIGQGTQQATLVLAADDDAKPWTGLMRIEGTATINGQEVIREARSATITWPLPAQQQQNLAAISRMDRGPALAVRPDKALYTLTSEATSLKALPGDKVTIPVKLKRGDDFKLPVAVTLLNGPQAPQQPRGNNPRNQQPNTIAPDKDDAKLELEVRPGTPAGTYTPIDRGEAPPTPNPPNTNN